jgi:phenylpyruvate tautomerase PptA (4-oxalocrotonate tautomerase family)
MNSRKHNKKEVASETTDLAVQTLHSANEYIMPGVHKFSKNLGTFSKFGEPDG